MSGVLLDAKLAREVIDALYREGERHHVNATVRGNREYPPQQQSLNRCARLNLLADKVSRAAMSPDEGRVACSRVGPCGQPAILEVLEQRCGRTASRLWHPVCKRHEPRMGQVTRPVQRGKRR